MWNTSHRAQIEGLAQYHIQLTTEHLIFLVGLNCTTGDGKDKPHKGLLLVSASCNHADHLWIFSSKHLAVIKLLNMGENKTLPEEGSRTPPCARRSQTSWGWEWMTHSHSHHRAKGTSDAPPHSGRGHDPAPQRGTAPFIHTGLQPVPRKLRPEQHRVAAEKQPSTGTKSRHFPYILIVSEIIPPGLPSGDGSVQRHLFQRTPHCHFLSPQPPR